MKQAHTESLDSSVLASIAVILSSQFIAPHRADPGGAPPDEIYQTTNLYHSRHSQHCEDNFTLTTHNTTQLASLGCSALNTRKLNILHWELVSPIVSLDGALYRRSLLSVVSVVSVSHQVGRILIACQSELSSEDTQVASSSQVLTGLLQRLSEL